MTPNFQRTERAVFQCGCDVEDRTDGAEWHGSTWTALEELGPADSLAYEYECLTPVITVPSGFTFSVTAELTRGECSVIIVSRI